MAAPKPPTLAKLIMGILRLPEVEWEAICYQLERTFGTIDYQSPWVPFTFTNYYQAEMGKNLWRGYIAFQKLINPDKLPEIKQLTNQIELNYADSTGNRRINIDPGYLTLHNLVLASCKPFSHRIYLRDGIYAEVTLLYQRGGYTPLPWTYPDYRANAQVFNYLRKRLH